MDVKPSLPGAELLSGRAARLLDGSSMNMSYIGKFIESQADLWAPGNPGGWVPLCVAENKLNGGMLRQRLEQYSGYPPGVMNYGGFKGLDELRAALAAVMGRTFLHGLHPALDAAHLCVLSGSSPVLEDLAYLIGDPGDAVLIPAPYYPAFDNDLAARAGLVPVPVHLDGAAGVALGAQLAAAAEEERARRGRRTVGLLVTHPNNPTGEVYSEEDVASMLGWCLEAGVHYIADEVYALSVFAPGAPPFVSALTVASRLVAAGRAAQAAVDAQLHLVYGLSKDWCGSGLRLGVLHTRSAALQAAINPMMPFGGVSAWAQLPLADALADTAFVDAFLERTRGLLRESYSAVAGALQRAGIPFRPAVAGMFVWIDLRQYLSKRGSWEAEWALWERLCSRCRVVLTPGKDCHAREPGYFRLCFAWMPVEAVEEAVRRMAEELPQHI